MFLTIENNSCTFWLKMTAVLLVSFGSIGCSAKHKANNSDPLEGFNRGVYKFNRTVDGMYIKPTSYIYKNIVPEAVRSYVGNFLHNIGEVPTTANSLLQGNAKGVGNGVMRLALNSTLGIFGFFDVATPIGFPREQQDFGKTLAKWGYKESPYLVIPILGPSTVRDGIGLVGNTFMSVPYYWAPKWRNRHLFVSTIQKRSDLEGLEKVVEAAGVDEYTLVRNSYLQRRNYEIGKNNGSGSPDILEGPPE
jgi:phospholipid-binding lipoprotein MlaA